jgi:hypothetical protein
MATTPDLHVFITLDLSGFQAGLAQALAAAERAEAIWRPWASRHGVLALRHTSARRRMRQVTRARQRRSW